MSRFLRLVPRSPERQIWWSQGPTAGACVQLERIHIGANIGGAGAGNNWRDTLFLTNFNNNEAFPSSTRPEVNQTKRRVTADPKNEAE